MAQSKVLTDANQRAVLCNLTSARERALFLLSAKAGLRAVEIAHLTWGRIREEDTVLELLRTKGDKHRQVPINAQLREALRDHRSQSQHTCDDDFVFLARHALPGAPLTANAVAAWFYDLYSRRLGWTGYSSHSGRRTFITNAARRATLAGGSLKDVQDMAGHESLKTTQGYIEGSSDAKRKLVDMV